MERKVMILRSVKKWTYLFQISEALESAIKKKNFLPILSA